MGAARSIEGFGAWLAVAMLACACSEDRAEYAPTSSDRSRDRPGSSDGQAGDDSTPPTQGDASTARPGEWIPPTEPVGLIEFLDLHIDKVCAWVKRCRGLEDCDGDPSRLGESRHMRRVIPPEVEAGRLAYDPEEGLRCLQAQMACGNTVDFQLVCGPVFHGLVELGGDCYSPADQYECAEGGCLGASCPGRCGVPVELREDGEMCGVASCKAGSICAVPDYSRGVYLCGPERGKGEACDEHSACSSGLHCSNGICADRIAHGARCTYDHECVPTDLCHFLHDQVHVCQTLKRVGSSCTPGETVCEDGSTCVVKGEPPGTCVPTVGLGKSCALAQCSSGLTCDQERYICVTAGNLGDPCKAICDFPLRCIEGECRNGAEVGESCDSSASCRADLYCNSAGVCRERGGAWAECDPDADDSCDSFQLGCLQNADADADAGTGTTEYTCRPRCEGPDSVAAPGDRP